MELREGYKQTEVGVIPSDWEIFLLRELFSFSGGHTASRDQLSGDGFCYLHYGDIHKSNKAYINVKNEYHEIPKLNVPIKMVPQKSLLNDGDVVFVDASEDDEGASKHIVVQNQDGINYISGLHTIVSKSKNDYVDNGYKQHCFQTADVKRQFKFYAVGTKVSGISKANIAKIQIPLPPTKAEQTAIAAALSDADALIQSLEKLIAKKRDIKQGAMQELLKPKEGWVVKKLGEICEINMGQSPSSTNYNTSGVGLPLVQGNADIADRKTIIRNYTSQITKKCNAGDIIMSVRAPVGEIAIATFDACIGRGVCAISYPNDFLYHYLIFIEAQWAKHSTGSTFDSVNFDTIWALEINTPPPPEQTHIATILSDMDAEIAALETKLVKYGQIKQGMMQELLTGRTRLV